MGKYTREPNLQDFKEWMEKDRESAQEFFDDIILPNILDLEANDYFGTEGFDKRFG
jgi:hypothetical protein